MTMWRVLLLWTLTLGVQAQPQAEDPSARIAAERAELQAQRQRVEQDHEAQQRACWQRFAVNACLSELRRSRRVALEPIRARELALNAQERAWRTQQREERLKDKAPGERP